MNFQMISFWLLLGVLPYDIKWRCTRRRRELAVRALFWSLQIKHSGRKKEGSKACVCSCPWLYGCGAPCQPPGRLRGRRGGTTRGNVRRNKRPLLRVVSPGNGHFQLKYGRDRREQRPTAKAAVTTNLKVQAAGVEGAMAVFKSGLRRAYVVRRGWSVIIGLLRFEHAPGLNILRIIAVGELAGQP